MSLIHLSESARTAFFAKLVGDSFNKPYSEGVIRRMVTPPVSVPGDISKNIYPLFKRHNQPKSLTPPQIYNHMTSTAYAEELVDELNTQEDK